MSPSDIQGPPAATLSPVFNPRTVRSGRLLSALVAVLVLTVRTDGYHDDPAGLSWWYAAAYCCPPPP
ncbi:hypothetical protein [Streptomyces sp. AP-93]|uniref:hypothetical protein n=1 Tax=Streptomyces sp. AP-93 TaxID=2929048 RepID=UPI001FAEC450|nr:hypothetical protein [Streptomyces sp. AP-93]MCJ0873851.1 hypothetical protein [Streptomyces sp. AP-93]